MQLCVLCGKEESFRNLVAEEFEKIISFLYLMVEAKIHVLFLEEVYG